MPNSSGLSDPTTWEPGDAASNEPWRRELTDEAVRKFQELMKRECGVDLTFNQARSRGGELVSLACMIADPESWGRKRQAYLDELRAYPTADPIVPSPDPASQPDSRPFPIILAKDHTDELRKNLELVRDELRFVTRRPSNWRYPVVGMYAALGHALVLRLGKGAPAPTDPLHHLTALYAAAVGQGILPRSRAMQRSVEELERVRTSHLTLPISRWPIGPIRLPGLFDECLSVILALADELLGETSETIRDFGGLVQRRVRELPPPKRNAR